MSAIAVEHLSAAACGSSLEAAGLRAAPLPFARVPGQSRLFLDYLQDPPALRRFYPNAAREHYEAALRAPEVLAHYKTDRARLCGALERLNRGWGAGEATLANVKLLREADSVAVVTGQQAGLFTGPLYTIYKALSAVKLTRCLNERGVRAVPVFWIATEDHDFDEVAWAEYICCNCNLTRVNAPLDWHAEGQMVGRVTMDERINEVLATVLEDCPDSEFRPDVEKIIRAAYAPGRSFSDAFARMMTDLLGGYGLVFFDPLDAELKQMAAPLYAAAARHGAEIAAAIEARSRQLAADGYHAQVAANANSFPLFMLGENGARRALTRQADGRYQAKTGGASYAAEELADWAAREPERFSPNVTLRAVVQDYLLPTLCYYGGAAEIAYFAQTAEAYRILQRPATPIMHRASLTFVERHTSRALERFSLDLPDLFVGLEPLLARVVEEHLSADAAHAFGRADETINRELDALQTELRAVDPTLAAALDTGRRKIMYQLDGLRTRYHHAQMRRDEATHRQIERAMNALYPHKGLQERSLNIVWLIARHGRYVVNWIHDAINLGSHDHQVVYL
jgi:bacillithiol biosynthesis cysteine-adding enzyme BshC